MRRIIIILIEHVVVYRYNMLNPLQIGVRSGIQNGSDGFAASRNYNGKFLTCVDTVRVGRCC